MSPFTLSNTEVFDTFEIWVVDHNKIRTAVELKWTQQSKKMQEKNSIVRGSPLPLRVKGRNKAVKKTSETCLFFFFNSIGKMQILVKNIHVTKKMIKPLHIFYVPQNQLGIKPLKLYDLLRSLNLGRNLTQIKTKKIKKCVCLASSSMLITWTISKNI